MDAEVNATPANAEIWAVEFNHGLACPQAVATQAVPVAKSIEMALNSKVVGQMVRKMFNVDGKAKGESPVNKALFKKTVDTRVRGGLINGWPTQEIANLMATDVDVCRSASGEPDGSGGESRSAARRWRLPARPRRTCSGR